MRRAISVFALPLVFVLAVAVMASVYIVDVREKALVLRFGEVVAVREEPGLGLKLPIIDQVVTYDARILGLTTEPMEVTPLDDRRLVVDAFARWQITDVVRFRRAVGDGGIAFAESRLAGIMTNAIRGVLGSVPSTTVLSDDRTSLMNQIRDTARRDAENLGVQVIDVRLTRTDLPEQNLAATYARMRAEREREAADEIARGGEAAQRVRATADRTVVELTSDARRKAEVVRGEADARRNAIYAEAFGRDPEFFAFTRSMTAYERALGGTNSSMVLAPDGEFFSYLGGERGEGALTGAPATPAVPRDTGAQPGASVDPAGASAPAAADGAAAVLPGATPDATADAGVTATRVTTPASLAVDEAAPATGAAPVPAGAVEPVPSGNAAGAPAGASSPVAPTASN